jgi:hypothetical protein
MLLDRHSVLMMMTPTARPRQIADTSRPDHDAHPHAMIPSSPTIHDHRYFRATSSLMILEKLDLRTHVHAQVGSREQTLEFCRPHFGDCHFCWLPPDWLSTLFAASRLIEARYVFATMAALSFLYPAPPCIFSAREREDLVR